MRRRRKRKRIELDEFDLFIKHVYTYSSSALSRASTFESKYLTVSIEFWLKKKKKIRLFC